MQTVKQNALKILGWLYKNNVTFTSKLTVKEIKDALKMPPQEFDEARFYLLQERLVEGTLGGDAGACWLTSEGMNIAEEAVSERSFWQRKKDDIYLLVIGAVLGIVGTILFQFLTKIQF
jgi:hypothetical protein